MIHTGLLGATLIDGPQFRAWIVFASFMVPIALAWIGSAVYLFMLLLILGSML